jgi:hypothetical protein
MHFVQPNADRFVDHRDERRALDAVGWIERLDVAAEQSREHRDAAAPPGGHWLIAASPEADRLGVRAAGPQNRTSCTGFAGAARRSRRRRDGAWACGSNSGKIKRFDADYADRANRFQERQIFKADLPRIRLAGSGFRWADPRRSALLYPPTVQ